MLNPPIALAIVHPTFPWDHSDLIPEWRRTEVLVEASRVLARLAKMAAKMEGSLILIDPGSGANLPQDVAESLSILRRRANLSVAGEAAASSDSAAIAITHFLQERLSVVIGGFWKDRCCRDLRTSLSRYRSRFADVEICARFTMKTPL